MTEFQITCTSCATRLKVNKPSLVGKILACPKCGTMLSIVVPKEHRPPPNDTSTAGPESSTIPLKRELTTNDFNEIDLLLQKNEVLPGNVNTDPKQRFYGSSLPGIQENGNEARTDRSLLDQPVRKKTATNSNASPASREEPKSKPQSAPGIGTKGKPGSNLPAAAQTPANQNGPLLPNDRWISPEIQRRRRMVVLLVASLGLISVLLVTAISLVKGIGKSKPEQLASSNDPALENGVGVVSDKDKESDAAGKNETEAGAPPADPSVTEKVDPDKAEKEDVADGADGVTTDLADLNTPLPIETSDPPPMIPGQSPELPNSTEVTPAPDALSQTPTQAPTKTVADGSSENPVSPPPIPLPPPTVETKKPDEQTEQRLERLAQLIEGSSVNVSKLKDLAASEKEESSVGASRFMIKKSEKPLDSVDNVLKVPCESFKYEKVRLSILVPDLMRITGIPMTLDLASIKASQGTNDPVIDLELTSGDFSAVIESFSESARVSRKITDSNGFVFHSADRDELVEAKYDPPKFKLENGEESAKLVGEFIVYIQSMIEADSWNRQEDPPSILLIESENKIKVKHNRMVQARIAELIAKMNGVIALGENLEDADSQLALQTKASLSAAMFAKPSKLGHRLEEPLLEVLSQLSEETEINIVADWDRLESLGWRPSTLIPGNLYSETLGGFVSELTHALGVTYVVIDEKTLLLTSFEGAASHTDLEVFHFGLFLKGKVKDEFALSAISSLLRNEFNHPLVRVYFEKRVKSLFVIAPQSVLRKVERLLKAIVEM